MGEVYRGAATVLSWLGADPWLVRGLQWALYISQQWSRMKKEYERVKNEARRQISEVLGRHQMTARGLPLASEAEQTTLVMINGKATLYINFGAFRFKDSPTPKSQYLAVGIMRKTQELWRDPVELNNLLCLLNAEYWKRVWTLQEEVLADTASHFFMSGPLMARMLDLDPALEFLWAFILTEISLFMGNTPHSDFVEERILPGITSNVRLVEGPSMEQSEATEVLRLRNVLQSLLMAKLTSWKSTRMMQTGKARIGLLFSLQAFSFGRTATDPRGLVYGLLNLFPPDHGIEPDYRRSVRDVYIDWAIRAIRSTGNLQLLIFGGGGGTRKRRLLRSQRQCQNRSIQRL